MQMGEEDDFDEELQRALALSRESAPPPAPPPAPTASADVLVLGQIPTRFRVYAASLAGRLELECTGRVLLPRSCLAVFTSFLGEMPGTLLLRLVGGEGSACVVGVADFIDDEVAASLLAAAAGPRARELPLPRLYDRGPLAACFVPRWVRGALLVDPACPEAFLQIVTLPLATHMLLRPHRDDFATALASSGDGDVRATLTSLMNRYPAVATGAVLALQLDGTSHLLDVLALRGLAHVRCGASASSQHDIARLNAEQPVAAEEASGAAELGGADLGLPDSPDASAAVPAACLVDADVNVDFAPSVEAEAAEVRARAQAEAAMEAAQAERRRLAEQAVAAAAQHADPWSAATAGAGHVLGSVDAPQCRSSELATPTSANEMLCDQNCTSMSTLSK